ncbi:hypothetical protein EDD21DRAFT_358774 [Dissophora ornata]|nr:hypothetical protein EDD21DRAFT_358774 [Dissophora ornata]
MFGLSSPITPTDMRLLEEYALNPESRPDVVRSCNPGSKEYFLLHLRLLSQELQDPTTPVTAEKIEEAHQLLRQAETLNVFYADRTVLEQFQSQLALSAYPIKPELLFKQLDFNPDSLMQLNNSGGTTSSKKSKQKKQQEPRDLCDELPTALDENLIKTEVLLDQLMDKLTETFNLSNVPALAWPHLLAHPKMETYLLKTLTPDNLLALFGRLDLSVSSKILSVTEGSKDDDADRFQMDRLIVHVIVRLYQEQKLDFTQDLGRIIYLTSAQLEMIKTELPNVMASEGFVGQLERRILPKVFVESSKPKSDVRAEWLLRMLAFVDTLLPKFNRHKLAVYLMSLEFDMARGIMDKDKFMRYIAIPRTHQNYNSEFLKRAYSQQMQVVDTNDGAALAYWSDRVEPVNKARDEETVKKYLSHFMQQEKSVADYEEYFELDSYLNPLLARVMLTSGDQDIEKWSKLLPMFENLDSLTEQTIIKFTQDNPETFLPSDPVVFKLSVKNANRILVRVFEMKTLEYLQQNEGPVGKELNLDGLTPNWEHNLTLDHPPLEIHELKIDLPELAGRRGAFVMDVICNGENSTAYFTKGYLDFVERQSIAGHVLTIIDENRQKISDNVSVWFNGFYYEEARIVQ